MKRPQLGLTDDFEKGSASVGAPIHFSVPARRRSCRNGVLAARILGLGGRFSAAWPNSTNNDLRMHDPIATGRRGAMRAVVVSALVAAVAALAALALAGLESAGAVALGAVAMLVGNLAAVMVALRGGIMPARAAFARLVLGTAGKWLLVVAVMAVALAVLKLPALPMLVGLLAAEVAYLLALGLWNGRLQD